MEAITSWILVLLLVLWLAWEFWKTPKRSPGMAIANALIVALCCWILSMGKVNWLTTVPVQLWWAIAVTAGALVTYSMWPRKAV
ncbi:hypothetical protein WG915_06035 [Corynebacterium sp. H128]|uniref:hypothetical protein n=1 Tax=unclassified Corynebacterium TaxID=2624378 RepID=UPI0030A0586D